MNKNIKIRKRRFFAFLLTILLVLNSLPLSVFAAQHIGKIQEEGALKIGSKLNGGDSIYFSGGETFNVYIYYTDSDPTHQNASVKRTESDSSGRESSHIVLTYQDLVYYENWKTAYQNHRYK